MSSLLCSPVSGAGSLPPWSVTTRMYEGNGECSVTDQVTITSPLGGSSEHTWVVPTFYSISGHSSHTSNKSRAMIYAEMLSSSPGMTL